MSDFKAEFVEAYSADHTDLLDLAIELPLVHKPAVTIHGNPYSDDLEITVEGVQLANYDKDTEEGEEARMLAVMGATDLVFLGGVASMELIASEYNSVRPERNIENSPEDQEIVKAVGRKVELQFEDAQYAHNAWYFTDNDTDQTIRVTTSRMTDRTDIVGARVLTMTVQDDYMKKVLSVKELPISFSGETALEIDQHIAPLEDETLRLASELLEGSGHPEGMGVIMQLFSAELTGLESADEAVAGLLATYEHSDKLPQLLTVLEQVRENAAAAKRGSAFKIANPDMTLPSADELFEYKALLGRLRA